MSLLSTWTKNNRVVTQGLNTVYTRVIMGDSGEMYWLYMRRRTKEYEYIGLTQSAAISCAQSMNKLYSRRLLEQEWYSAGTAPNPNSMWQFVTGTATTDRSYNPTSVFTNHVTERLQCGSAIPQRESGDAWKVVVKVDEQLSYNYRQLQCSDSGAPLPWEAFETDPNSGHYEFYGAITSEAENYDTADNGYGSPT